ncbi:MULTISPECIES: carbohydrate ABC transporter permease [unclassified Jeotgalibaca]|uniref:carbohydrate ABC transporter permease n=1 Tax=unclassified Jeotgalibaca TaxID=2621505 RepID=UPI003FD5CDEF
MTKTKKVAVYAFLIAVSIVFAFPFYFLIVSATNLSIDVTNGKLLPGTNLIANFQKLLETVDIVTAAKNSTIVSLSQTFFSLLVASLAGYGFEIHKSRGKEIVFRILLLSMMIPFAAIMIPLFRMFGTISSVAPAIGIDTLFSAYLPYLATAFLVFFFRQNTKMFPKELLEAGRIDGLSELGCFFFIFIPTMKTTYAAAAIITFMGSWNNYLWPLIVLQSPENQTIPLLISNLGAGYSPDYGMIMLAIMIATIPTAAIFFFLQKHFVAGMLGSVK